MLLCTYFRSVVILMKHEELSTTKQMGWTKQRSGICSNHFSDSDLNNELFGLEFGRKWLILNKDGQMLSPSFREHHCLSIKATDFPVSLRQKRHQQKTLPSV